MDRKRRLAAAVVAVLCTVAAVAAYVAAAGGDTVTDTAAIDAGTRAGVKSAKVDANFVDAMTQSGIHGAALDAAVVGAGSQAAVAAESPARLGVGEMTRGAIAVPSKPVLAAESVQTYSGVRRLDDAALDTAVRAVLGQRSVDRQLLVDALRTGFTTVDHSTLGDSAVGRPAIVSVASGILDATIGTAANIGAYGLAGVGDLVRYLAGRQDVSAARLSDEVAVEHAPESAARIADLFSTNAVYMRPESSSILVEIDQAVGYGARDAPGLKSSVDTLMTRTPGTFASVAMSSTASVGAAARASTALGEDAAAGLKTGQEDRASLVESVDVSVTTREADTKCRPVATPARDKASAAGSPAPPLCPSSTRPDDGPPDESATAVVPPPPDSSPSKKGEATSVVWPTLPATVQVPEHGITLHVPVGARQSVFQTRITVESKDALEVPPAGEVLRVVRIDWFDALGRPIPEHLPDKPLDLVIRLDAAELDGLRIGDAMTATVQGDPVQAGLEAGIVRLQRFEPIDPEVPGDESSVEANDQAGVWRDIPVHEVNGDSIAATLDHLSLFALIRVIAPDDAGGDEPISPAEVSIGDRTGNGRRMATLAAILAAGLLALAAVVWLVALVARRSQRAEQ